MYWVVYQVLSSPGFWLAGFFVIVAALVPFLFIDTTCFLNAKDVADAFKGKNIYKVQPAPIRRQTLVAYVNPAATTEF